MWRAYLTPRTLEEALAMLAGHRGEARIIAGGTDLVLQSQRGRCPSTVMVDITRLPGLDGIGERDGYIQIGALVTHGQVATSPLIRERAGPLAQACGWVGGPQIRNVATLVGNVVNALPAADGAVALFALDAEAEVATQRGRRWEPIAELYKGVGLCTIDSCAELVTGLRFRPLGPEHRSAYQRLAQRRSLALPIVTVAAVVAVAEGRLTEARIAIGPVAPTPFRAARAEAALVGQPPTAELFAQAAALAAADAHPRDSATRGSKEYRLDMVETLVRRALESAAR